MRLGFLLLLFVAFGVSADAQSMANTTWKVYNNGVIVSYRQFTEDSVRHSTDNVDYTTTGMYWTNGESLYMVDLGVFCPDTGSYTFTFSGDTVIFQLIADPCIFRASAMSTLDWVSLYPLQIANVNRASNTLSIHQDPAFTRLFLKTSGSTSRYEVYDAMGRVLFAGHLTNSHAEVDISVMPAGCYFVRTTNAKALPFYKL